MGVTQVDRVPVGSPPRSVRRWWSLVLLGGMLGIVGTVWQTVERIAYESGSGSAVCDINTVLSCGNVYSHWQSSALGVPNSLIGLPVFAVMTSAAVSALLGSRLSGGFVAALWGLGVFMTLFAVWYMQQSAFDIGALCLFCTASLVNILLVVTGLTRVAAAQDALGNRFLGRQVRVLTDSGGDLVLWGGLAVVVAMMLVAGLVL